jgi:hypothetical protein
MDEILLKIETSVSASIVDAEKARNASNAALLSSQRYIEMMNGEGGSGEGGSVGDISVAVSEITNPQHHQDGQNGSFDIEVEHEKQARTNHENNRQIHEHQSTNDEKDTVAASLASTLATTPMALQPRNVRPPVPPRNDDDDVISDRIRELEQENLSLKSSLFSAQTSLASTQNELDTLSVAFGRQREVLGKQTIEVGEALDTARTNILQREKLEEWLTKALGEIDDLRNQIDVIEEGGNGENGEVGEENGYYEGSDPVEPPLSSPTPYIPSSRVRRSSDLYNSSPPPTSSSPRTLSDLGRSLLHQNRRKMSPQKQQQAKTPPPHQTSTASLAGRSPTTYHPGSNQLVQWPSSSTKMFNHLRVGPNVGSVVVGILRDSSVYIEGLCKRGKTDGLFEGVRGGEGINGSIPGTPGVKGTQEGRDGGEENFGNVDLVEEVSEYVESVQRVLLEKVEDLENINTFCKYLEQNVLVG